MAGGFLDHRAYGPDVAHVCRDDQDFSAGLANEIGGDFKLQSRARGDCDVGAGLGERLGHRQSKPAPAARDQGHTAIEAKARHLKFVVSGHSSFNIHSIFLIASIAEYPISHTINAVATHSPTVTH